MTTAFLSFCGSCSISRGACYSTTPLPSHVEERQIRWPTIRRPRLEKQINIGEPNRLGRIFVVFDVVLCCNAERYWLSGCPSCTYNSVFCRCLRRAHIHAPKACLPFWLWQHLSAHRSFLNTSNALRWKRRFCVYKLESGKHDPKSVKMTCHENEVWEVRVSFTASTVKTIFIQYYWLFLLAFRTQSKVELFGVPVTLQWVPINVRTTQRGGKTMRSSVERFMMNNMLYFVVLPFLENDVIQVVRQESYDVADEAGQCYSFSFALTRQYVHLLTPSRSVTDC